MANKSVCADCKRKFSFDDEGGFLWGGYSFCENCDPEGPKMIDCPNHNGSYDCTPFCELCAGAQEVEG
jgi:hypothetical protein